MHSGELARLAGVTVRTLRHYHQVGLLDEPERRSNGYRDYGVQSLVRVLRIKRLAALGIPLDRMPALLDDSAGPDADPRKLLDELDLELAEQMDRLAAQRALIARLREHSVAPDLPPELAPFFAVFATADLSPELVRADRDQSVLLAHLVGDDAMPFLERFYERLARPEMVPAVTEIAERFARLGPGSTDEESAALAEKFVLTFRPVLTELVAAGEHIDLSGSAELVGEYTSGQLNEQQLRMIERLEGRFELPGEPGLT
ncbi:MerR family transcriptional regulator [Promicromonospora kroppenstedtii]|uniref:MerR family transcriptional regulator n=1 Tax=Promicromonospora kroppenstedtii TaxID=440482 RepID=A0ABW7XCV7_9MICO